MKLGLTISLIFALLQTIEMSRTPSPQPAVSKRFQQSTAEVLYKEQPNSSDPLNEMTLNETTCGDMWSCKKYDFQKLEKSMRGYYVDMNCACDPLCPLFQDCCPDANYSVELGAEEKGLRLETFEKPSMIDSVFECINDPEISYSNNVAIVARCPNTWDDESLAEQCHNSTDDDLMSRLPVSGVNTRFLYRNMFCAVCHQEPFLYWRAAASCSDRNGLPYDINATRFMDVAKDKSHCSITYHSPARDYGWRPCVSEDIISKCNDTFLQDTSLRREIAKRCTSEGYQLVYSYTQIYRNQFCALCNHLTLDDVSCNRPYYSTFVNMPKNRTRYPYSFSILLDINSRQGITTVGNKNVFQNVTREESFSCDTSHVFDPFLSRCRLVTCGVGRYFENNKCVKNMSSEMNETSAFYNPDCNFIRLEDVDFKITENGSLVHLSTGIVYNSSVYIITDNGTYLCVNYTQNYTRLVNDMQVIHELSYSFEEAVVSSCGLAISLLALAVTIVVYSTLRPLHNIPGLNLLSLVSALFLADTLLIVAAAAEELPVACAVVAGVMHYFFLAAFMWMNVMAIDVWFTFSKAFVKAGDRGKSSKRFMMYSAYAWFTPAVFVVTAALVQVLDADSPVNPRYGDIICWVSSKMALVVFFAIPLGLLLLINATLFVISAHNIAQARASARVLGRQEDLKMAIYIKLTLVMGLTWVLGFLAALVPDVKALQYTFIILNTLQGLFICISFVSTKKVLHLLKSKLCSKKIRISKTVSTDLTNVSKSRSSSSAAIIRRLSSNQSLKILNNVTL